MRIISKFKDYYDSVQGVMYDENITYIRKSEKVDVSDIITFPYYHTLLDCELVLIGFCGRIFIVHIFAKPCPYDRHEKVELKHYIKEHNLKAYNVPNGYGGIEVVADYSLQNTVKFNVENSRYYAERYSKSLNELLEFSVKIEKLNLSQKYQTPMFTLRTAGHREVTLNTAPTLKDFNFQSQFDPYTAYQEIVMWIGAQAVNEYPPQITDNIVLRDAKGFDKWSFKTMKGQKKKRGGKNVKD